MKRNVVYTVLAALLLAVVAFLFFYPDDVEGNVLRQHDIMQGLANGQEGKLFHEETGETTRWTNSLFSGMPNFQIAPSYPANRALDWVGKAFGLWLPSPANLLFSMMLGFFIMCLCLKFKWYNALFASLAWGFSSYFIIIIGAGHIWKFVTLAYIPPTIGGIALCYRGRYLAGMAVASLFGALQLMSNHPQMSYYFMMVVVLMMLAWLWTAWKAHKLKVWVLATLCVAFAGCLAVAANSPSLYNSYEYARETVRGRATDLTPAQGAGSDTGGMDRQAITAWSYGLDESFSLLVPNVKGGATIKPVAGENSLLGVDQTAKADELPLSMEERQFISQFPQYFGDQPMTNGPVYVGAFVLVLAVLALFVVEGPMKWALFAASVLALALSWGHNFAPLTDFFIDNFPGYNRFRAVASILVVVEFTVPLLAVMCVRKMMETPDFLSRYKWTLYSVAGLGALICLAGWLSPSVFGSPFSAMETEQLSQMGLFGNPQYAGVINAVRETRLSLVSADCLRSLIFILLGAGVTLLYLKGAFRNKALFACALAGVVIIDLYPVGKRYVDTASFTAPAPMEESFRMTDADRAILADTSYYRVMDIGGFSDARSSYFHKTIGGYHAAKLTRYNDLITRQLSQTPNLNVLDMLNAKYFLNGEEYQLNPGALGNAWFVDSLFYVDGADAEMAALDTLTPGRVAVADRAFSKVLGAGTSPRQPGDSIWLTHYAPNRLSYKSKSARGGLAVFSEVYFPWGWTATVDGKTVPVGRVDYVLRAIKLPAGSHEVVMAFDPQSVRATNTAATVSVALIYLLCGVALVWVALPLIRARRRKEER